MMTDKPTEQIVVVVPEVDMTGDGNLANSFRARIKQWTSTHLVLERISDSAEISMKWVANGVYEWIGAGGICGVFAPLNQAHQEQTP